LIRRNVRLLAFLIWAAVSLCASAAQPSKPNIIFILADDLGYGELGCFGQKIIQTSNLDRMAREGMRFTQFYAGSTVCAPSRCVLMTGKHTGHCSVRGNAGGAKQALLPGEKTVAEVLKGAGYSTALIGKWGLGDFEPGGEHALPTREGFDYFFGYANQNHAHNYYPDVLFRNEERVPLKNGVMPAKNAGSFKTFISGAATNRVDYSHDLLAQEALDWLRAQKKEKPFFLFLAFTIPHANNEGKNLFGDGAEVPDYGIYADNDWPNPNKGHAAMITRMDRDVGRVLDLLKQLDVDKNTLVIFSSDNGPHNESGRDAKFFSSSGPFTGLKRSMHEGGIRVPTIAWWPGTVKASKTSHLAYFGDFYATVCDLIGQETPAGLDSISFAPTLTSKGRQKKHDYLYWEFYEQGSRQAVRFGNYKAIREPMLTGKVQLFDLSKDLREENDLSSEKPKLVKKAASLLDAAHVYDPQWEIKPAGPNEIP